MTMTAISDWYDRIPEAERHIVDAYAKWLNPIPWQFFVTLTFPWDATSETADQKLKELLNALERELKNSICFMAGKERKARSAGMNVPWHFHVLMTAQCPIPKDLIEIWWRQLVGASGTGGLGKDDSVLVVPYDKNKRGVEYCLKLVNDCNGDWASRWLQLFHPTIKRTSQPDHRTLRQEKRFAGRSRPQGATRT
jgi:hypothetical protein